MYRKKIRSFKYFLKSIISRRQIIGYPKSGNTWIRMLIYNYFLDKFKFNFQDSFFDEARINIKNESNIIFSHGTKDRRIQKMTDANIDPFISKNNKTIFLVRDPRDVLVSLFYHEVYRYGSKKYSEDIWKKMFLLKDKSDDPTFSGFIRSDIRGINYIVDFMNYWFANKEKYSDFKIITYEDLHNTRETMREILNFFSIDINEESIDKAIYNSSFDKMRSKEIHLGGSEIDMSIPKNLNDIRTYKVRKGIIGSYKKELFNIDDLNYVNDIIKQKLNKIFKY